MQNWLRAPHGYGTGLIICTKSKRAKSLTTEQPATEEAHREEEDEQEDRRGRRAGAIA